MSAWTVLWIVVAWVVAGGALVLALIAIQVASARRRQRQFVQIMKADVLEWARDNGWEAKHSPRELTAGGIAEVNAGEHRHLTLMGEIATRPAAIMWCVWESDSASLRYATLLVELANSYPDLRISQRHGISGAASGLLTGELRAAIIRLQPVTGGHDEFIRLEGRVLRVVVKDWPEPQRMQELLNAVADVVVAWPIPGR